LGTNRSRESGPLWKQMPEIRRSRRSKC